MYLARPTEDIGMDSILVVIFSFVFQLVHLLTGSSPWRAFSLIWKFHEFDQRFSGCNYKKLNPPAGT